VWLDAIFDLLDSLKTGKVCVSVCVCVCVCVDAIFDLLDSLKTGKVYVCVCVCVRARMQIPSLIFLTARRRAK